MPGRVQLFRRGGRIFVVVGVLDGDRFLDLRFFRTVVRDIKACPECKDGEKNAHNNQIITPEHFFLQGVFLPDQPQQKDEEGQRQNREIALLSEGNVAKQKP